MVALHDLCSNFLYPCQMICKQYIVLTHMLFWYESNLEPITVMFLHWSVILFTERVGAVWWRGVGFCCLGGCHEGVFCEGVSWRTSHTSRRYASYWNTLLLLATMKLWPRLCFYMCVWFCSQGGFWADPPGMENPPGTRQTHPPGPGRPPLGPADTPPDQADAPVRENPPGKKTAAYGQWAAGTHPTGMHSCYNLNLPFKR